MAYDYSFKKFAHQPRQNYPEETFAGGMNYTDSPIEAGQSKMLLNFDIADDGVSLKPRAGIKVASAAILHPDINTTLLAALPDATKANISAAGEYSDNGVIYKYAVIFDTSTKKVFLCTISDNIKVTAIQELDCEGMKMVDAEVEGIYNDYSDLAIHDLTVSKDTPAVKQQVGTKAWNDAYFFFGKKNGVTKLYNTKFDPSTKQFYFNEVVATELTALEASPNKYNMLLQNPYSFQNTITAGAFVAHGVLPYLAGKLVVSPKLNTKYNYRLNYSAPSGGTYTVKWEWKDYNGTEWTLLKSESVTMGSTAPTISCDFASPIKTSLLRVTITNSGASYPDQVVATGINCESETQTSALNSELKVYSLGKATGMCYWQNRLILWGFDNDNIILASETNLPEWFPYPNNMDAFEEPIIHCEPYLDYLLVFTMNKLYKLTMLSDGSGWSKTCIQANLNITKYDTNFIKTVKNMVFFKSGNSFYMVVPSASTSAEGLTIAPISKPIQWMLDNFSRVVTEVLEDSYNYKEELALEYCFNYINNTDIVIDYMFKDNTGMFINFCLLYNTETRTWRTHMFESETRYTMFKLDATSDGVLMTLTNIESRFNDMFIGKFMYKTAPLIQFLKRTPNEPNDYYISNGLKHYPAITGAILDGDAEPEFGDVPELFKKAHKYKNYQFLDTGYRALDYPNNKKRHREFQIRFNNKSEEPLQFGTSFYVDGEDRKNMYKYVVKHDTDKDSENYGLITVVPELHTSIYVQGTTILHDVLNEVNTWELNVSQFPQVPLIKARVAVSGKGYHNRLKLLSVNEKNYEVLGLCWVYKIMNLR